MSDRPMTPIVISPQEYKATQISESKRLAAENELDEGPEGGRYLMGDKAVDANGNPLKESEGRPAAPAGTTGPAGATGANRNPR
jgi:hypothetical protein